MDVIIGVVASFIGVFVGAFLSQRTANTQRRLTVTFELHRELHGAEMMRARHSAAELIEEHRDLDYAELRDLVGQPGVSDLHQVIYFFQRLWVAIEYGSLRNEYVPRFFGDCFSWWYEATFRSTLVPLPIEIARDIQALWMWLESNSTAEQRQGWRGANPEAWKRVPGSGV